MLSAAELSSIVTTGSLLFVGHELYLSGLSYPDASQPSAITFSASRHSTSQIISLGQSSYVASQVRMEAYHTIQLTTDWTSVNKPLAIIADDNCDE